MVTVLVCSVDAGLSDLVAWNLARRGCEVRQVAWAPCCSVPRQPLGDADLIVVDLDCPEPTCWRAAVRVREHFKRRPLVFLAHDPPDAGRLRRLQPSRYVQKPFGIDELLGIVRETVAAGP